MLPQPLVSIIIPTTHDRKSWNESIQSMAIAQDYPNRQILFDYEGGVIGAKRNRQCEKADGDIILHFDSDDWYMPTYVSAVVRHMLETDCDITGLKTMNLYDPANHMGYRYSFNSSVPFAIGATLAYKRTWWKDNPFSHIQICEDEKFVNGTRGRKPKVVNHDHIALFLASIHEGNTSKRLLKHENYRQLTPNEQSHIEGMFGQYLKM